MKYDPLLNSLPKRNKIDENSPHTRDISRELGEKYLSGPKRTPEQQKKKQVICKHFKRAIPSGIALFLYINSLLSVKFFGQTQRKPTMGTKTKKQIKKGEIIMFEIISIMVKAFMVCILVANAMVHT